MSPLTPCPACSRHVRERSCPFCGADVPPPALRPRFVGPATRAAIFSVAVAGCWTGPVAEPATSTTTTTKPDDTAHDTTPPATTGAIDGTVIDQTSGQPVAGAQVSLDGKQVTTTDYNGHYKFSGVAAGNHTVTVATHGNRAHGGGAYAALNVTVHSGLARADIQVVLPQPTFDPNSIPKPYGAPPARRRLV